MCPLIAFLLFLCFDSLSEDMESSKLTEVSRLRMHIRLRCSCPTRHIHLHTKLAFLLALPGMAQPRQKWTCRTARSTIPMPNHANWLPTNHLHTISSGAASWTEATPSALRWRSRRTLGLGTGSRARKVFHTMFVSPSRVMVRISMQSKLRSQENAG